VDSSHLKQLCAFLNYTEKCDPNR